MRTRLFAIIILLLLIIVPVIGYWYFMHQKRAKIIFRSEKPTQFTISLQGTLEYQYFPLLDSALSFSKTCDSVCEMIVPPAKYTLHYTLTGREPQMDTVIVRFAEEKKYSIPVAPELILKESGNYESVEQSRSRGNGYDIIGSGKNKRTYAFSSSDNGKSTLGIVSSGSYISLRELPVSLESAYMDIPGEHIIIRQRGGNQYIYDLSLEENMPVSFLEKVLFIESSSGSKKIRTENGVYTDQNGNWKKNPRFSDYIDVSDTLRIGYIDVSDTDMLSLQGFPSDRSVLVYLDRTTNTAFLLKNGLDILGFTSLQGEKALVTKDGKIYTLTLGS